MTQYIPFMITAAYLVVAVLIGFRAGRGHDMNTAEGWGVGSRSMSSIVVYLLVAAGGVSAYTFMGSPGWAHDKGAPALYVVVYLAYMAIIAWYFGPRVWELGRKYGHTTQSSAVADRYESKLLGGLTAIVGSIGGLAYAVLQTIGSAYILNVMSFGLIPIWLGVVVTLAVISIYLFRSGLRAIGLTNAFQGALMFIVAWLVGLWAVQWFTGGFNARPIFERLQTEAPEFLTLPGALGDMNYAFWTTSILISFFSIWQSHWIAWMGASSAQGLRRATTYLPLYYLVLIPMIIVGFIGIFEYPDIAKSDQVAIQMAVDNMPFIVAGLLGAGTLAASMSSSEPNIHATALTYSKDVVQPLFRMSDTKAGRLTRWLIFPIMALVIAPISIMEPASLVYILLIGYGFIGQLFPTLMGIFFWPRATAPGAIAGLIAGFIVTVLFSFVFVHPLGVHAGIWGLAVNVPVFVVVSFLTKPASRGTLARFFDDAPARELADDHHRPR
ncbi:sodium:solute symporter family protein [Brevibacterium sp. R8603A2]|uniref:sodium:solute symporter family protein n=1 Tax=Brevibacterium sp. R8603A2 TaxID=2929779 RepID=UPI001FF7B446|nr:sodium:solute symporter family protein [Brevibacterium sp. R8603A2]MCK1803408.1 sodium:solute symporter family protein [Brevibacterium sp. R8603A2]